jgi:hypothetical protein
MPFKLENQLIDGTLSLQTPARQALAKRQAKHRLLYGSPQRLLLLLLLLLRRRRLRCYRTHTATVGQRHAPQKTTT